MISELNIIENILLYFNVEPEELPLQNKKTYLAINLEIPVIGQAFSCNVLQSKKGELSLNTFTTTMVVNIMVKSENLFIVETLKTFYILLLPCKPSNDVLFSKDLVPPQANTYNCFNEIVFSKYNEKYIFQVVRRSNIYTKKIVKISEDIYYAETDYFNYFILIQHY